MDTNQKSLAKEIKRARLSAGWSQMQLAYNAGVSVATIYRLESGRVIPRPAILAAIRNALEPWRS